MFVCMVLHLSLICFSVHSEQSESANSASPIAELRSLSVISLTLNLSKTSWLLFMMIMSFPRLRGLRQRLILICRNSLQCKMIMSFPRLRGLRPYIVNERGTEAFIMIMSFPRLRGLRLICIICKSHFVGFI